MDTTALRLKLKSTPPPIRSWFASEEVSLLIQTINQHFNLQGKDASILPMLLARLEARDIAPDYFAGELADELKLDRDKALGISAEVKRNILTPLTKDFLDFGIDVSLLDKFQIPTIKGLSPTTGVAKTDAPKILQDVTIAPQPTLTPAPLPIVGWSKMSPSSIPTPPRPPVMEVASGQHVSEPAPMILHEDTSFKAAEKNVSFTLARPNAGADTHMSQTAAAPAPVRPAVMEFGGVKPPAPPVNRTPTTPAPSAIRYADSGPRSVSQITPPAPLPTPPPMPPRPPAPTTAFASAPIPPMPPKPPQPPTPPQAASKPIVKDFL